MLYNKNNKSKKMDFLTKDKKIDNYLLLGLSVVGFVLGLLVVAGIVHLNAEKVENETAMGCILIGISLVSFILSTRAIRKSKKPSFLKDFANEINNNNYKSNLILKYGIDADLIDAQIFDESIFIGIEYSYGVFAEAIVDKFGLFISIEYTNEFLDKYDFDEELIVSEEEVKLDENVTFDQVYEKLVEFYNKNKESANDFIKKYLEK